MKREEKLEKYLDYQYMYENGDPSYINGIKVGVSWADENPKSPWISVEDELPKEGTAILEAYTLVVTCNDLREEKECVVISRYNRGFVGDGAVIKHPMNATTCSTTHHWMPIPELPKEEIL